MSVEAHQKTIAELQAMAPSSPAKRRNSRWPARAQKELDATIVELQDQIKAAKIANAGATEHPRLQRGRDPCLIIDLLLKEAGWALDKPEDREFPVTGMPNPSGTGKVDYVLWDDDGKPLGLVEAKRTIKDAKEGQHQAKLYADALEAEYGQRPVIFYTNGYQTHIWDDLNYPPREIQGFYTKDELRLAVQRRTSRQALAGVPINEEIVEPRLPGPGDPPDRRKPSSSSIGAQRCWSWPPAPVRPGRSSRWRTC